MLEVIVAVAVFSLIASAMAVMVLGGSSALIQGGQQTEAEYLAQQGIEIARSIRDQAWNNMIFNQSSVSTSSEQWVFDGEGTNQTIGKYTRIISFSDVCRDSSDEITTCPGVYTDLHAKKVTVDVSWEVRNGISNTVQQIAYLTNWDSQDWTQTDWSGGIGTSTSTEYQSDGGFIVTSTVGELSLLSGTTQDGGFDFSIDSNYSWPFDTDSNYVYDSADIEVTGGMAQLLTGATATTTGATSNSDFTSNANNWTFNTWGVGGGEVTPTGVWQSTGGNTGGYVDINVPYNAKNDVLGGYWEQSINISENSSTVTCSFDWRIAQWVAAQGVDDYQFYVFLDSTTGEPTIGSQVWSSGTQGGTSAWSGQQDIDCSSVATASGTYYYKIAVWLDTKGGKNTGPITAGYDNASVSWEKAAGSAYPTDRPTIYPSNSLVVSGLSGWSSFAEIATKNSGEIYYQLSNNDGSTWQYWNGSAWATTGASNYNTAATINTNIGSFGTLNSKIMFKAFLESDGTQLVQLDNVSIGYNTGGSVWSFYAWDVDGGEVTPSGNQNTSGGNPGNYVDITVPAGGGDEVGGYWQQSFTTLNNSPVSTSINFDYKVVDYNGTPNIVHVRAYVDTATGDPVTQVGSSISITGEGSWTGSATIDPSSAITTAGTYYLKLALWVETPTGGGGPSAEGPYTVGFDNVDLGLGTGGYVTSSYVVSAEFDMGDPSPVQIIDWDQDISSCTTTCNIQMQLRVAPDSSGSPGIWTDWYGASGTSSYFTATSGTLITTDLNWDQWLQYRAELNGDGSGTPILQEVRVNYK